MLGKMDQCKAYHGYGVTQEDIPCPRRKPVAAAEDSDEEIATLDNSNGVDINVAGAMEMNQEEEEMNHGRRRWR